MCICFKIVTDTCKKVQNNISNYFCSLCWEYQSIFEHNSLGDLNFLLIIYIISIDTMLIDLHERLRSLSHQGHGHTPYVKCHAPQEQQFTSITNQPGRMLRPNVQCCILHEFSPHTYLRCIIMLSIIAIH